MRQMDGAEQPHGGMTVKDCDEKLGVPHNQANGTESSGKNHGSVGSIDVIYYVGLI